MIEPLRERIVVQRDEAPDKIGEIWVPETVRSRRPAVSGTVVAVGPGYYQPGGSFVPLEFEVGDRVGFSSFAGTEILVDGSAHLMLVPEEIICRLPREANVEPAA